MLLHLNMNKRACKPSKSDKDRVTDSAIILTVDTYVRGYVLSVTQYLCCDYLVDLKYLFIHNLRCTMHMNVILYKC